MKTKFFVLGAISILALVACQREPQAPVNPTYNPDDNTVLTKLILNVSSASGSETKQTAEAVQAGGGNFRGMQDVHLLTYDIPDAKHGPKGADDFFLYDLTSATQGKDFDLGVMMLPGTADSEKGTRVLELALPLQTNAILLYGRATRTGLDADEKLGHVDASGNTLADVTFSLKNRMNNQLDKFKLFGDLMGRILTGIMNTGLEVHRPERGYKATDTEDGRYDFWWPIDDYSKALPHWVTEPNPGADPPVEGVHIPDGETRYNESTGKTYTMHWGNILWSTLGEKYAKKESLTALEEVMGEAYANIMTLQTGKSDPKLPQPDLKELRAASSAAVLRLTQDLYSILVRVLAADPTNASEKIAQLLAVEIVKRAKSFYAVDSEGVVSYQPLSIIMTNVANLIPVTTDYSAITDDFFYREAEGDKPKQMGFPINLGLPAGSAIMSFMNPSKMPGAQAGAPDYNVVVYMDAIPSYGIGGDSFPVDNYRYPAELMYYTNSGIYTSKDAKEKKDFPEYTAGWSIPASWNTWEGPKRIASSTQSVAVSKTVNYGTALLSTKVAYSADKINDNNKGLHPSENPNTIDVAATPDLFEITGIMISGVCDQVGWNFLPKTNAFNYMIYDDLSYDDISGKGIFIPKYSTDESVRYTKDLYTLTFDNYDSSKDPDKQNKVFVALEIVNRTGQDLWGELNLIRKDGTFYLVGELDPTSATSQKYFKKTDGIIDLSRDDFNYPPFDAGGNTINAPRVFMQDYVTNVTLKFTAKSLSKAYLTVPDLRSGQVSLGLSVDVNWQKGFEFDVPLGGGTVN